MFRKSNLIVLLFFSSLLIVSITIMLYYQLKSYLCQYDVITNVYSPDNLYTFVLYGRRCVIFNNDSIKATVLESDELLGYHKNDMFMIEPTSLNKLEIYDNKLLKAIWKDSKTLSVIYDEKIKIINKKTSFKDVSIIYYKEKG